MEVAKSLEELRDESKTLDYFTKFLFITPSEETKNSQQKILRYFFDFTEIEGKDLKEKFNNFCSKGIQAHAWAEDKIYQYLIELKRLSELPKTDKKRIGAGTIKNRKMVLRKLLKVAKIPFDWELVNPTLPKVTKNASKDRAYSLEEIHTMCKYPDRRIKPIVYTAAAAGLRLGAWNYLKVKHVQPILDNNTGKILCGQIEVYEDEEEGEEYTYRTLITKEAYDILQEWIEFRKKSGENVTEESWLMRDLWDTKAGFTHGKVREPKQLKASGIKSLIDSALRRTGLRVNLPEGRRRHEVMLTHGFKKWRETALVATGMPEINLNTLMGHGNPGMIDYYNRPDLVKEFLKAEEFLIIDEANKSLDKVKEEIKKDVTKDVETKYEIQNREMMRKIKEFEDQSIYFAFNFEMQRIASLSKEQTEVEIKKNGGKPKVIDWTHEEQINHFVEMMKKIGRSITDEQKETLAQYLKNSKPTLIWQKMSKEEEEYDKYMEEEYAAEKERLSKMTEEEIEDEEKKSLELHAKIQREYNKMSPAEMENESRLYDRLVQKNARRK